MSSSPISNGTWRTSKGSGWAIEHLSIETVDELDPVSDNVAEWHDARVDGLLEPSEDLEFYGLLVLEDGTPVEIKGARVEISNGPGSVVSGRWFIKRAAHDRLLEAGGAYLLVVYDPALDGEIVSRAIVPATVVDGLLEGRWSDVDADRSEDVVAKLSWRDVLDPSRRRST